jgi:hypothetical protein
LLHPVVCALGPSVAQPSVGGSGRG